MTVTETETTKERLERQRSKLLNRRAELQEAIEAAPANIAILRERWLHSESPRDEQKLKKERQLESDLASDLEDVNASLVAIDALLAVEYEKENEARLEALRLEGEALVEAEREAFVEFGKEFEELYDVWVKRVAPAIRAAHNHWVDNIRPVGAAQHATLLVPLKFGPAFRMFYLSALERDYIRHTLADEFIGQLAAHDERIDVSGDGLSEAPGI